MTVTKIWHFGESKPLLIDHKKGVKDLDKATQTILKIGNVVNHGRLISGEARSISAASVMSSTMGDDPAQAKSRWVGQPTDVALLDLLDAFEEVDARNQSAYKNPVFETPFSSERKWMGVVIGGEGGGQDTAFIKGALEQIIRKCDTYVTSNGQKIVLDEARRKEAIDSANHMAQEGLRVLGFASGPVSKPAIAALQSRSGRSTPSNKPGVSSPAGSISNNSKEDELYSGLTFAGLVGMNDPPRKGVDRAVRRLMAGGVRVVMVTGDSEATAVAIGKQLGLPIVASSSTSVLRGDQVEQMTDQELTQAVATTTIFARTSPDHKLKIVKAFQARGDVVAMTGDGVNDAPALKKADIGISMGKTGTDVAKEAADMILTDDDFSTILNAIEEGKGIFYNIQNFLTFQLSTSAAALSLVLMSTVCGFKNPLNAMQILWISKFIPLIQDDPLTYPRHSHGRPSSPIAWCRTCRSRHHEPTTPSQKRPRSHQSSHQTRSSICRCHYGRHSAHLHS
jgi:Ca2+-transporting ATPase